MAAQTTPTSTAAAPGTIPTAPVQYPFLANPNAARFDLLTAQALRILTGGDPTADSPYDKREVRLSIEQHAKSLQAAIDTANTDRTRAAYIENQAFLKSEYFSDLDALHKFGGTSEAFIRTFRNWPVLTDADTGEKYLQLPDEFAKKPRYTNLPGEESVRNVEPVKLMDRYKRRYVMLAAGQYTLLLRGGIGLQGNYGVERHGDRLILCAEHGQAPTPDTTVNWEAVDRPLRDGLLAPGVIADAQDTAIIAATVADLMRRVQEDKINDNVANQA
jgi:hypothetical protein